MRYNSLIKPDEILTQSIGVGVGAALVTWAIVAGYPTAKYLICKKKYNQSVKEYGELHEEITQ